MKRDALLEWKKITALATNALNVLSLRGFYVILEPKKEYEFRRKKVEMCGKNDLKK